MFKMAWAVKYTCCLMYQYLQTKDETEVPSRTASSQVRILEFVWVYRSQFFLAASNPQRFSRAPKNRVETILYLVRRPSNWTVRDLMRFDWKYRLAWSHWESNRSGKGPSGLIIISIWLSSPSSGITGNSGTPVSNSNSKHPKLQMSMLAQFTCE